MSHKDKTRFDLKSNVNNQPSEIPITNYKYRVIDRKKWVVQNNFIV